MDLAALQQLLTAVSGAKIACVGDLMVDRFVYGEVNRVSPEAPIPVLARRRELVMLGAAGNVARNAAALGGQVRLVGLIGGDAEGHEALRLVQAEAGVEGFRMNEAVRLLRAMRGKHVVGGDVVCLMPTKDQPNNITAMVADAVMFEMIDLVADRMQAK